MYSNEHTNDFDSSLYLIDVIQLFYFYGLIIYTKKKKKTFRGFNHETMFLPPLF